ncbi:ABSCISIC ACID-INSENSITIVE 5-like protein 2 isoform X2 [Oryza brachyantha]|uniref:ABSCISIC ACID-INSENSITIVE 5-like protein 2 isoform X2 n=1 Tax=Oryza brachyantha TaxID=4533 RepID=UPI001ADB6ACA|nr:ABSCISIC ACID-INSENSITIVE 5-like protein 2 isoform X2 [Oryza brachyantha]
MGAQAMSSHHGGSGGVSRQGSLCGLALSEVEGQLHGVNLDDLTRTGGAGAGRRTVDEVWRDIQGTTGNGFLRPAAGSAGQMTLEDFLSRTGAVAPDDADSGTGSGGCAVDGARWGHPHHHHVGRPVPRPLGVGTGPVLDALYHDGTVSGRKRAPAAAAAGEGAAAEKTVERRKKRMIKNRESAARSRARKQAYTNELENKISRLEEENKRLRMHKEPEPVVQYVPQQEPKNQLRRVNSADF